MSENARAMGHANKKHFDEMAAHRYDKMDWAVKISNDTVQFLRQNLDFIGADWIVPGEQNGRPVRLLDYACGPGMVSRALGPYVSECKGIDVSPHMVKRYNSIATEEATVPCVAVEGNLLAPDTEHEAALESTDLYGFQVAAVGYGFHHFADVDAAVAKLTERLRPGGVLIIIDFSDDRELGPNVPKGAIINHGFSESTMRQIFERAGLIEFGYKIMPEPVKLPMHSHEVDKYAFVSRATKPS